MRRSSKRSRWPSIRRNLLLGVLLGFLQLLALGEVIAFWHLNFPWWLYVGVGVLFYLLIPGLAGFLAALKTGDDNAGVDAGCLVGTVGILISITAALIINAQTHLPPCGIDCPGAGFLIFFVVISEGLGGTIAAVIGSSVGEALGKRRFLALYQSRASLENPKD